MLTKKIYLDNNATTQLSPAVLDCMMQDLSGLPYNPSSIHSLGQEAKRFLLNARHSVASSLKAKPEEVFFTSSGTEALNTLIKGFIDLHPEAHILSSDIEHSAIYNTLNTLKKKGHPVTFVSTGIPGKVSLDLIERACTSSTQLIVLSAANSETGVIHDYAPIAAFAKSKGIHFILDAVGIFGKAPFTIPSGVTGCAFSAHKVHGPKGAGVMYIHHSLKVSPLITGGGQEYGIRAGTENLAGILGLAKAFEIASQDIEEITKSMSELRDLFESEVKKTLPDVIINGEASRVSNTSNLAFPGIDGESLLINLDLAGVCASHGSACTSGAIEPSRVLRNMGIGFKQAASSIRFSLCRYTQKEEILDAVKILAQIVNKIKKL